MTDDKTNQQGPLSLADRLRQQGTPNARFTQRMQGSSNSVWCASARVERSPSKNKMMEDKAEQKCSLSREKQEEFGASRLPKVSVGERPNSGTLVKEFDENAYYESMRIQDEIDEMNDRDRESDEFFEAVKRELYANERKQREKEKSERLTESLEELRKNLTFIENADGKLELVKRDDCNPQMNIHIHKIN